MSGPYESVPTAHTSFAATASTPRMTWPGVKLVSVQLDPFQCSAIDAHSTSYGVSMTRAPTAQTSLEAAPETASGGHPIPDQPTAQASFAAIASTPSRRIPYCRFGVGTTFHEAPS